MTEPTDATEQLLAAIAAVQAEVRMRGEETAHRLDRMAERLDGLESADRTLTGEFQRLKDKVDDIDHRQARLDREVGIIRGRGDQTRQTLDEERAARAAEMAGIIRHIEKATTTLNERGEALGALQEEFSALKASDEKQSKALDAIVGELGIEDKVSIRPPAADGEKPPKKKPTVLARLDRRANSSTVVQIIIALGMIANLLKETLLH